MLNGDGAFQILFYLNTFLRERWGKLDERYILRLRGLVIPLLTKSLIIYSEMMSIYRFLLYLKIMMFKKCSKFH